MVHPGETRKIRARPSTDLVGLAKKLEPCGFAQESLRKIFESNAVSTGNAQEASDSLCSRLSEGGDPVAAKSQRKCKTPRSFNPGGGCVEYQADEKDNSKRSPIEAAAQRARSMTASNCRGH